MKTKFGALVVDGRGKIGGHVASKNRGGSYLRTKVSPVNPQTVSQSGIRGNFTARSQAWRSLTQAQRDAWNGAVSDYARTDIFGDLRNPSGINLYQRLNNVLVSMGVAVISVPPLPESVAAVVMSAVTATAGTDAVGIVFAPTVPAGTGVKIFATAPTSAGKSFVKSEYRFIGTIDAAETSPFDATALYVAKFGNTGAIGQKIFVKIVPVNLTTGQTGGVSSASVITVA